MLPPLTPASGASLVSPERTRTRVERGAEDLGRDRRDAGVGAGHVDVARRGRDAAVAVQPADRAGAHLPPGKRPAARPMPSFSGRASRRSHSGCAASASSVSRMPVAATRMPSRRMSPAAGHVAEPQLDRVDAELSRELVDERLDRERGRRRHRRAVGARAEAVRADAVRLHASTLRTSTRRRPCRPRSRPGDESAKAPPSTSTRASQRRQRPVRARADLEVDHRAGARIRRGEVLAPREGEPHRPADASAAPTTSGSISAKLAAEAAAERRALDADLRQRKPVDRARCRRATQNVVCVLERTATPPSPSGQATATCGSR